MNGCTEGDRSCGAMDEMLACFVCCFREPVHFSKILLHAIILTRTKVTTIHDTLLALSPQVQTPTVYTFKKKYTFVAVVSTFISKHFKY